MKKSLIALALLLILLAVAFPTTAPHSATLGWSGNTAGAMYNVYKANCLGTVTNGVCSQESSFTKITSTPLPASQFSYVDTNVVGGASYSYYVTAYCDAALLNCGSSVTPGESAPSSHIATTIPKDGVAAPSAVTITAT